MQPLGYTTIFLIEIICRIGAWRLAFFISNHWWWNWLDVFLVLTSLVELLMSNIIGTSNIRMVRFIRIARLCKVFRLVRIVRIVHALRTLVLSIVSTMKSLVWAILLLLLIIYVFGILFTQATSEHLYDEFGGNDVEFTPNAISLNRYWSRLPRSMFTLFKSITGGISWDEIADPLSDLSWVWVGIFTAYICFCFLAVLNVVTGVFCQTAIQTAQQNEDLIVQAQMRNKKMYIERIKRMFDEIDSDGSGFITMKEFEEHLQKGTIEAVFSSLSIDTDDAWTLFQLLDDDKGNSLDADEFVHGCLRLKGNAKSIDVAKLSRDQNRLYNMVKTFIQLQNQRHAQLTRAIQDICCSPGRGEAN